nr:LD-carboxypeptidase [Bacillus thuringiensis]
MFCGGGGYGSGGVVGEIEYEVIRENGKMLWGYRDIRGLHSGV